MNKSLLFIPVLFALSACMTTEASTIEAVKVDDNKLTCTQITEEMSDLDTIIVEAEQRKTSAHATNVGSAVAGHAAGLGGLPFVGAAISHAGSLSNMGAAELEKKAEQAQMRKNTLTGLYVGKGC